MNKCKIEETQERIQHLCKDINACIYDIVMARIKKDPMDEGKDLFYMGGLMVEAERTLMAIHDLLDARQETSKDENPTLSDVKEQATEAAILTARFEFEKFCDCESIEFGERLDYDIFSVNKEYWAKDFERKIRSKLQAHQP